MEQVKSHESGSAPAGWHRFGWYGVPIAVPETWNLTAHRGDARAGMLHFADLRAGRLEVRWQRVRRPARKVAAMRARLERGAATVKGWAGLEDVWQVSTGNEMLLLAAGTRRTYEMRWIEARDFAGATAEALLAGLAERDEASFWPWRVYGAEGLVHAQATLRTVDMRPGAIRLEFVRRRARKVLGSWSMADRLLKQRGVREWAAEAIPLVKNHPHGTWASDGAADVFRVATRRMLAWRPLQHELTLRHDHDANRIVWVQRSFPAGKEQAC